MRLEGNITEGWKKDLTTTSMSAARLDVYCQEAHRAKKASEQEGACEVLPALSTYTEDSRFLIDCI